MHQQENNSPDDNCADSSPELLPTAESGGLKRGLSARQVQMIAIGMLLLYVFEYSV